MQHLVLYLPPPDSCTHDESDEDWATEAHTHNKLVYELVDENDLYGLE